MAYLDSRQETDAATLRGPRTHRTSELLLMLMAIATSVIAYILVGVGVEGTVPANVYQYSAWLIALALVVHIMVRWRAKYADPVILPIAVMLNGIGLAMIFRIDLAEGREGGDAVAVSQLVWMTLGVIAACVVLVFLRDHRILRRYTYTSGFFAILLLLLPLIPGLGTTINGARIWIAVGPMSFQPGEVAKILLAIFFAGYLVSFRDSLVLAGPKFLGMQFPRLRDLGPIIICWIASVGVLVFQRDLGTSLLFFGLFVAMLYVATAKKTWIFLGLGMFAAGAVLAATMFSHVQLRVDGWLNALSPEEYNKTPGGSFQLVNGLFGMANGGLLGTGLGQGRPDLVPYAESDFIIASLGEELGMIGIFAILLLYVLLLERSMRVAMGVRDGFGKLFAAGIGFTIALQCFIVVGGVTRLIPLTGLTTPFLAAGGSSLVANWIIIGLLLRISDNARRPQEEFETGVLSITPDREAEPSRRRGKEESAGWENWAKGLVSRRRGDGGDASPGDRAAGAGVATSQEALTEAHPSVSPSQQYPTNEGAQPENTRRGGRH